MSPRPPAYRIAVAFATLYLVWGSTYLAIRWAVEALPPFLLAGARFLVAGAMLHAWARWRGAPAVTRAQWGGAAAAAFFLFVLGNGLTTWAETRIPSAATALIVAGTPVWVALIDRQRGGEALTGGRILGLVLGLAGLAVLVWPAGADHPAHVDPLGAVALLVASLGWAYGSVRVRDLPLPRHPVLSASLQMLCGGAVLAALGLAAGEAAALDLSHVPARAWLAWGYLMALGSMVAFSAFQWLVHHVPPTRTATTAYVNPIIAVLLGWWLGGEHISLRMLAAAAIIIAGVVLIFFSDPIGRMLARRRTTRAAAA